MTKEQTQGILQALYDQYGERFVYLGRGREFLIPDAKEFAAVGLLDSEKDRRTFTMSFWVGRAKGLHFFVKETSEIAIANDKGYRAAVSRKVSL